MTKVKAIALCRVSTPEQRENNSLNRQEQNVRKAAEILDCEIVHTISGDVSSKVGKNIDRPDLKEALELAKSCRSIKFLIVDEVDRFMRSIGEMFYWIETFKLAGLKVHFASNPELNNDDSKAKLLLSLDGFKAEGSNEERQRKSVNGHITAIKEGRRTFPPLPGYSKSGKPGVHTWHKDIGSVWQSTLKAVAARLSTPSEALKIYNEKIAALGYNPIKMDKFLHFIVNPYYCGIIEIGGQINTRCESGQHEPMITKTEHDSIVKVVNGRVTKHARRQQYNPEFPMNKIMLHDCQPDAKFTGSNQSNGKGKVYPKHRCRACGAQYHRDDVHKAINNVFNKLTYYSSQRKDFIAALANVWNQRQQDNIRRLKMLQSQRDKLECNKSGLVRELANASESIKPDILNEIHKLKTQIQDVDTELAASNEMQSDLVEFVAFALEYTNRLKDEWWQLGKDERLMCQQLLFPGGLVFKSDKKVSTASMSPLYRLASNKKELHEDRSSLLVERVAKSWHCLEHNIANWRELLYSDYERYKLNRLELHLG